MKLILPFLALILLFFNSCDSNIQETNDSDSNKSYSDEINESNVDIPFKHWQEHKQIELLKGLVKTCVKRVFKAHDNEKGNPEKEDLLSSTKSTYDKNGVLTSLVEKDGNGNIKDSLYLVKSDEETRIYHKFYRESNIIEIQIWKLDSVGFITDIEHYKNDTKYLTIHNVFGYDIDDNDTTKRIPNQFVYVNQLIYSNRNDTTNVFQLFINDSLKVQHAINRKGEVLMNKRYDYVRNTITEYIDKDTITPNSNTIIREQFFDSQLSWIWERRKSDGQTFQIAEREIEYYK